MIEMPDFDNMSPKQIREWGNDLVRAANENGDIRATLQVQCMPGRPFHTLGIEFDEKRSTIVNLILILEKLLKRIRHNTKENEYVHNRMS
jgi:hypothetical protein